MGDDGRQEQEGQAAGAGGSDELAENLGRKIEVIELSGQRITLRALNLNDLVEIEQQNLGTGIQALRYELWVAARRAGYQGSLQEIGGLVQWEDTEKVRDALKRLAPPFVREKIEAEEALARRLNALGLGTGADGSGT